MAHVISFRSSKFDVARETPNPINPIAGESVLLWLREQLGKAGYQVTSPATEDWGWYVDVTDAGASYLVGASGDAGDPAASVEWTIQIHKHRSFVEKMTGANKMAADDPLSTLIERILRADPDVSEVEKDT